MTVPRGPSPPPAAWCSCSRPRPPPPNRSPASPIRGCGTAPGSPTSATLAPKTIALLNERAAALEHDTSGEIAIVIIRSLDELTIEDAAVKLFEMWAIGKKHGDNGLLFLWSTGVRRVRVEVGYGLEVRCRTARSARSSIST